MQSVTSRFVRGRRGVAAILALALVIATVPLIPVGMAMAATAPGTAESAAPAHCQDQDQDHEHEKGGVMDCGCNHGCALCAHGTSACLHGVLALPQDAPATTTGMPVSVYRYLPHGLPDRPPQDPLS